MWKQFLNNYFSYSHKERAAIGIIFTIVLILILLPLLYPFFIKQKQYSYTEFENEIVTLNAGKNDSAKNKQYAKNFDNELSDDYSLSSEKKYDGIKAEVFYFDPNTASSNDWKRLGLKEKTIHTIQNYLSKGGKFYKPEDIRKIWGLSSLDAQRLIPYVSIKNKREENAFFEKKEYSKTSSSYPVKTNQPIDVNLADTTAFISLPGIGSKLAQRIIAFRDKLGGFYSINQVAETYLLPDSTFQKIRGKLIISDSHVRQMNINTATIDEMKVHPYLRYNLANAIFQYRQQHGNYNSVEEVKKIMLVSEDVFDKIAPYLTVQ